MYSTCIYSYCNTVLLFTSQKKILTSVLLLGYVCSYINKNDLFQYQTRTTEWFDISFFRMHFVRVLCKEYRDRMS